MIKLGFHKYNCFLVLLIFKLSISPVTGTKIADVQPKTDLLFDVEQSETLENPEAGGTLQQLLVNQSVKMKETDSKSDTHPIQRYDNKMVMIEIDLRIHALRSNCENSVLIFFFSLLISFFVYNVSSFFRLLPIFLSFLCVLN